MAGGRRGEERKWWRKKTRVGRKGEGEKGRERESRSTVIIVEGLHFCLITKLDTRHAK